MNSVKTEQFNIPLAESQEEYNTLHVNFNVEDPMGPMTACFELTDEEIAEIVNTKKIYYQQCVFTRQVEDPQTGQIVTVPRHNFHPMSIHVVNPLGESEVEDELSK